MPKWIHNSVAMLTWLLALIQMSCASRSLERAVYAEDVAGVHRALKWGANPNFHVGEWEFAAGLLDMDMDFYDESAILVEAVETGNVEITRALLEAGADTAGTNSSDETALKVAATQWPNGAALVQLLLDHGADPNLKSDYPFRTPLEHAVGDCNLDTALLLYPVSQRPEFPDFGLVGVKRNDFGTLVVTVVRMFENGELPPTDAGLADFPAMTRAILLRRIDELQRLIEEEPENIEQRDRYKFTPLMWAASRFGSTEMTRLLLEAGADAKAQGDGRSTALDSAVEAGNAEAIRLLAAAGADPNVVNSYVEGRSTLLMSAAYLRRADVVRALLDAGADADVVMESRTPLSVAEFNNSEDRKTILSMLREALGTAGEERPHN